METVRACESMEGIRFMNHAKKLLLGSALLLAFLLNACGSSRSTSPTDTLSAIYTSAAQTIEAQDAANLQSAVDQNTNATPMETATLFPTNTPTLALMLPTSTLYTTTLGATGCDGAAYISDVTIPDNTVVEAGQAFVKTWMIQNTGSCTWDANYVLTFVSGDEMNGTNTAIGSSVASGQKLELSVTLAAPTLAGQYKGYWRLANDSGNLFGEAVYVLIDVTGDATATYEDTETPAFTATFTPVSYTPTVTPTAIPSSTPSPVPTSTPSPTSTPTPKS
jgi:hypothetical protein